MDEHMLLTLVLFVLFLGFAIAFALFWWFLTQVLPWLVIFYLAVLAIRVILALRSSEKTTASEAPQASWR